MKTKIYGLFKGRTCLYVGRANFPNQRAKQHRAQNTTLGIRFRVKILKTVDLDEAQRIEGEFIRFYKSKGEAEFNKRLNLNPRQSKLFIRNRNVVWYGPHQCPGCGATIVKSSIESGGIELDAPHGHHYPNHKWELHRCAKPEVAAKAPNKKLTDKSRHRV